MSLQSLLTDAQTKLDSLVATPAPQPRSAPVLPLAIGQEPIEDTRTAATESDPEAEAVAILARDAELARAKDKELWTMGGIGMLAGIGGSLLVASLAR